MPIPPPNPFDPDFSKMLYQQLAEFENLLNKWWSPSHGMLTDAEHDRLNQFYDYFSKLQDRFRSNTAELGTPEDTASYFNPVENTINAFRDSVRGGGGGTSFPSEGITEDVNRGVLKPLRFLAEDINNRLSGETGIGDILATQVMRELMRQRDPMTQFMQPNTPNNQQTL